VNRERGIGHARGHGHGHERKREEEGLSSSFFRARARARVRARSSSSLRKGILVGCDASQTWLFPWWWKNYSAHNNHPVFFVDFEQISLSVPKVENKEWEAIYGPDLHDARKSWFKKPAALLLSPFEKTIWIDLDCEILAPIDPLFDYNLAFARDCNGGYNSGVIVYTKNSPLIQNWALTAQHSSHLYMGDQNMLPEDPAIEELPPEYNWRMSQGLNPSARIIHWVGSWGKTFIREYGGLKRMTSDE